MKEELFFALIPVALLFSFLINKFVELSNDKKLKNLVGWCNYSKYQMRRFIEEADYKQAIDKRYFIQDEEWPLADIIISGIQSDTNRAFFQNELIIPKLKKSLLSIDEYTKLEYFMLRMANYLYDHSCDSLVFDQSMHQETLEYKKWGSYGGPCYDAKYSLSDFGIVYFKLEYLAFIFCKNNRKINPDGNLYRSTKGIEETIDSRTISISRL